MSSTNWTERDTFPISNGRVAIAVQQRLWAVSEELTRVTFPLSEAVR